MAVFLAFAFVRSSGNEGRRYIHLFHLLAVEVLCLKCLLKLATISFVNFYICTLAYLAYFVLLFVEDNSGVICILVGYSVLVGVVVLC